RGDAPAGGAVENVAEPAEIRDAVGRNPKALQTIEIFAAGAALQELLLALEQEPPDGVLILAIAGPVLLDRMIPQPAAHRVLRKVLPLAPRNTRAALQSRGWTDSNGLPGNPRY